MHGKKEGIEERKCLRKLINKETNSQYYEKNKLRNDVFVQISE